MTLTQNIVDLIVSSLNAAFHPIKIILFGSHAWGVPHQGSDVDILVIVDKSDLSPTRRAGLAFKALSALHFPKDILVRTTEEVNKYRDVPASLEHKILTKGRVVYG